MGGCHEELHRETLCVQLSLLPTSSLYLSGLTGWSEPVGPLTSTIRCCSKPGYHAKHHFSALTNLSLNLFIPIHQYPGCKSQFCYTPWSYSSQIFASKQMCVKCVRQYIWADFMCMWQRTFHITQLSMIFDLQLSLLTGRCICGNDSCINFIVSNYCHSEHVSCAHITLSLQLSDCQLFLASQSMLLKARSLNQPKMPHLFPLYRSYSSFFVR